MTNEQAITHVPHEGWPKSQGGGPCECNACTEARMLRSDLAHETREEAKRRGYSQSICDRAASFRLEPGMSVNSAIAEALRRDQ